jgi:T5SS/PEP-CTERM-associated repeat protein
MATYSWIKDGGGRWSDQNSWHFPDDANQKIPGPGDDVEIFVEGTITTGDASVNSVSLGDINTILNGGLTAKSVDGAGTLQGGDYSITTMSGTTFAGGTLTATTLDNGSKISGGTAEVGTLTASTVSGGKVTADNVTDSTLSGGKVDVTTLTRTTISGAEVDADHVAHGAHVNSGSLDTGALVLNDTDILVTTGGTVTADSLEMTDGDSGLLELAVFAGTMTVSGAASFTGSRGLMQVGHDNSSPPTYTGGALNLDGGFTLTALDDGSGNALQTFAGATTTIAGAVMVDMTSGTTGSTGLVVTGGTMNLTGTATLGQTAEGKLEVSQGGRANVGKVDAGELADSTGDIFVDSGGSRLSATGTVTVGVAGDGLLRVNGGIATLRTLVLGAEHGGHGQAVAFGTGARLSVSRDVTIGEKGTGDVTIESRFDAGDVVLAGKGSPIDKTGDGPKDDNGFSTQYGGTIAFDTTSAVATVDSFTLGEFGYARSNISGGSLTVKGDSILAKEEKSESQMSIDDGLWDTAGALTVAAAGKARVEVGATGTLTASGDTTVADEEGSDGQGFVDGGLWQAQGSLTVGSAGKARIDVFGSGTLQADSDLTIGEEKGGSGQVVLGDGSAGDGPGTLTVGGDLTIGGGGTGTLLSDLSAVTMSGGTTTLGEDKGSKGTLTVHGGTLTCRGEIVVGDAGSGTMTISQGAKLQGTSGNHVADLTLAEKVGATGSVTFDGAGTVATVGGIEDGVLGKGTLKITNGAMLTAQSADLATRASSNANGVTVDTAGTFVVTGDLTVGEKGFGTLSVKGAGQVDVSGDVGIAGDAASIGSATISGSLTRNGKTTASGLTYGTLGVGEGGSGTLTINKGADVSVTKGGDGSVEIGAEKGASGKLTLTDHGSVLSGDSIAVGGTEKAAGGKGSLSVAADAVATFDAATIWKTGSVALTGGTLHVTGSIDGNGAITIGKAGTLMLDGDDKTVAISFAEGSDGAALELAGAGLLQAAVKGFAVGDSIVIDGLDAHAAISAKIKGANTIVTIKDGGKDIGSLTLAGHFGKSTLDLSADGVLTTSGGKAAAKADAEAVRSAGATDDHRAHGLDIGSQFFGHHSSEPLVSTSHDAVAVEHWPGVGFSQDAFLF